MKSDSSKVGYYFLGSVILCYLVVFFIDSTFFKKALLSAWSIFAEIYYIFIIVFVLMVLIDYFIKPKQLKKYLGEKSGAKGWLVATIAGIISTGPIYMWYPLLYDLKKDGMRDSLVSVFLYNRAIKLPLIPIMLHYFSITYVITLSVLMVIAAIVQGYLLELILKRRNIL